MDKEEKDALSLLYKEITILSIELVVRLTREELTSRRNPSGSTFRISDKEEFKNLNLAIERLNWALGNPAGIEEDQLQ